MEIDEALAAVSEADARDRTERAQRLVELTALVGASDVVFSNQAAEWLFDDVKATWIYGYFAATVVAAHAYCLNHLAGLMLLRPDEPDLPDRVDSLEALAAVCADRGLIDLDVQAMVTELQASADAYLVTDLHVAPQRLERRLQEARLLTNDEQPLRTEARSALACCASLIFDR